MATLSCAYSRYQSFCSVSWSHTVTYNIFILSPLVLQLSEAEPAESAESTDVATGPTSGLNLQEVMKLIGVFEPSFSFLLLQLIKLMTTVKRKPRWGRIKKAQWYNSRVYVSNVLVIFTMLTPWTTPCFIAAIRMRRCWKPIRACTRSCCELRKMHLSSAESSSTWSSCSSWRHKREEMTWVRFRDNDMARKTLKT